MSMLVLGQTE